MNKYQEALNNICCGCYGGKDGCNGKDKFCINYLTLKELIDKNTKTKKEITTTVSGSYTIEVPNELPKNDSFKLYWGD